MKRIFLNILKAKALQPVWEKLFHVSKIGMNYWGTEVHASGELKAIEQIVKHCCSNAIVFDVGANKGQFISHVSQLFPPTAQFFSFEPSKGTFQHLQTNIQRWNLSNVRLFNFGLSESPSKQILYMDSEGSTRASLYQDETQYSSEEIELSTLDLICEQEDIRQIDFLKIDVEGHEISVLKGAMQMLEKGQIRFIQFEFGESNISSRTYFKDFFSILSNYNFFRILPGGLRKLKQYSPELEVFSTSNYLAVNKEEVFP
jgi:FkbM family methyltransferase